MDYSHVTITKRNNNNKSRRNFRFLHVSFKKRGHQISKCRCVSRKGTVSPTSSLNMTSSLRSPCHHPSVMFQPALIMRSFFHQIAPTCHHTTFPGRKYRMAVLTSSLCKCLSLPGSLSETVNRLFGHMIVPATGLVLI